MKLKIERSDLAALMSRGGSVSPRASTIPILSHVRLIASDRALSASTTDLDTQAESTAPAVVEQSGALTVSARAMTDFTSKLPANVSTISIEASAAGGSIVVKAGRNRATIPTLPVEDFPDLTVMKGGGSANFEITGADLDRLFGRTAIAISTEETRYYLNGTFLHVAERELRAVATNGHILIMTSIALPAGAERFPSHGAARSGVIVPAETVRTALRLFGRAEALAVTVGATGIAFEAGGARIVSKVIDGTFPDHERVIPQPGPFRVNLDKASALSAVNLIEVFHDRDSGHAIECGPDADGLAMVAGGKNDESAGFAVACADFEGELPSFGVSSKYLRNTLGAFGADVVTLALSDPGSPIRMTADTDSGVIGVIMPMRIARSRLANMGADQ